MNNSKEDVNSTQVRYVPFNWLSETQQKNTLLYIKHSKNKLALDVVNCLQ